MICVLVDRLKASIPSLTDQEYPRRDAYCRVAPHRPALPRPASSLPRVCLSSLPVRRCFATEKGVHNSFNSPDSINQFTWTNLQKYPQAFTFYKNLIQLRKNHPAFRLSTGDKVRQHLEFLPSQDANGNKQTCLVGFQLKNLEGIDAWKHIVVIYNFNKQAKKMLIPEGNYTVACCNGVINEEGLGFISRQRK